MFTILFSLRNIFISLNWITFHSNETKLRSFFCYFDNVFSVIKIRESYLVKNYVRLFQDFQRMIKTETAMPFTSFVRYGCYNSEKNSVDEKTSKEKLGSYGIQLQSRNDNLSNILRVVFDPFLPFVNYGKYVWLVGGLM